MTYLFELLVVIIIVRGLWRLCKQILLAYTKEVVKQTHKKSFKQGVEIGEARAASRFISQDAYITGYSMGTAATSAMRKPTLPAGVTVDELIQLCHPDHHQNSKLANKVTAKLLEMKK